jgi:hypothetical protein
MMLFGKTLAVERIYFWGLSVIGLMSIYIFSTAIIKNTSVRMFLCLMVLVNSLTCRISMTNMPFLFRQCFNLMSIYFIFQYYKSETKVFLFIAGFWAALSVLISQETGIFVIVAIFMYMIFSLIYNKNSRFFFLSISLFLIGIIFCFIIWTAYCYVNGCLKQYFINSFKDTLIMTGRYQHISLPDLLFLFNNNREPPSYYYHTLLTYIPPLISLTSILFALKLNLCVHSKIIPISIYGICSFAILLGRCDIYHSTFASLMFFVILFYWFEQTLSVTKKQIKYIARFLILLIFLTILSFNYEKFKGMFHLYGMGKKIVNSEILPSAGTAKIYVKQYDKIYKVKHYIESNTATSDPIFVMVNSPYYYFFIDRPTNTKFATPIFANNYESKSAIINDLTTTRYPFIIYDKSGYPDINYEYYCREINDFIKSEYVLVKTIESDVYIFKIRSVKKSSVH